MLFLYSLIFFILKLSLFTEANLQDRVNTVVWTLLPDVSCTCTVLSEPPRVHHFSEKIIRFSLFTEANLQDRVNTVVWTLLPHGTCTCTVLSEPPRVHHFSEKIIRAPIGHENCSNVDADMSTLPEQVSAMKALKDSLGVPDILAWKGDPCTPSIWEGVSCHPNTLPCGLVVTNIDLANKGLKGYISEMIGMLTNLNTLNLSSNSLIGEIPSGLAHTSLVSLDLSDNQLSGSIPGNLSYSSLTHLNLKNNHFQGMLPDEIYSVLVHSGYLNVSGNEDLCGVGLQDVLQCSIWIMASHRPGVFFALVTVFVMTVLALVPGTGGYDENQFGNILVMSRIQFRLKLAAGITLFHVVKVRLLYDYITQPQFSMEGSYIIWRCTVVRNFLEPFGFSCLVGSILMASFGRTRSFVRFALVGLCYLSFSQGALASMLIHEIPWLVHTERCLVFLTACIMIVFFDIREASPLRDLLLRARLLTLYLITNVGGPLLGLVVRSIGWIQYISLAISIYYTVTIIIMGS